MPVLNPYYIAVDIGTNSDGYCAVDEQGQLLHVKGKTVLGARLFKEGAPAADRRGMRVDRRRTKRAKGRIHFLNQIFRPYLKTIDTSFLHRIKTSNLVESDRDWSGPLLFPELEDGDGSYSRQYPTIYHVRKALMESHKKMDVRLIYLAMHHLIKHRGNFLSNAPVDSFKAQKLDLVTKLNELNQLYLNQFDVKLLNDTDLVKVQGAVFDRNLSNQNKKQQLTQLLTPQLSDKNLQKISKQTITAVINALLGFKFKVEKLVGDYDVSQLSKEDVKPLSFNDEEIDDELATWEPRLDDDQVSVVMLVHQLSNAVMLNTIVPNGLGISESMIQKYLQHHQQLHTLYKPLINSIDDKEIKTALRNAYAHYIDPRKYAKALQDEDPKHKYPNIKAINHVEFGEMVQSIFKKYHLSGSLVDQINQAIDTNQFMLKQRTADNGVIPHQMHEIELRQIIENQKQFYPWLATINPSQHDVKRVPYKIEQLLAFHIPYYVGPLASVQQSPYAWMVRKAPGLITPYNFYEKVDVVKSAQNFIKRLTVKDKYLLNADVLPAQSLLYEQFKVLNELNMVRVSDHQLSVGEKQIIFNELFKTKKHVSIKAFKQFLVDHHMTHLTIDQVKVSGLSDESGFVNGLNSYQDLKSIFGSLVDDPQYQHDLETIIHWSTVFEDSHIFATQLKTLRWLTPQQIKAVSQIRYRGWGKLSALLLTKVPNENGESIIQYLWNTNHNFQQAITNAHVKDVLTQLNQQFLQHHGHDQDLIEQVLSDAYTSPQNKKAIRQTLKVIGDIVKAKGGVAPAGIIMEFTRNPDDHPKRSVSRFKQLDALYKKLGNQVPKSLKQQLQAYAQSNLSDKLELYFRQLGRDMYDGQPLDLNQLHNYDIDHILPQSFIKNDSLNNRVLTKRGLNMQKTNGSVSKVATPAARALWAQLLKMGLLTKGKYYNLTLDPTNLNPHAQVGFINRQLVETSQVIKLVANLCGSLYPDSKVIEVPAKMNSQIRHAYGFYKNRNVNDYHHAFDAYLTALNGLYLYQRYPKLHPFFVYGENQFYDAKKVNLKHFNFLYDLIDRSVTKQPFGPDETVSAHYHHLLSAVAPKVYQYKKLLISKEVYTDHGQLYDRTHYSPRSGKTLVPVKNGMDVAKYGGYSSQKTAYMAIVRLQAKGKKPVEFKIVPILRINSDELARLKATDEQQYRNRLDELAGQQLSDTDKKRGYAVVYDKLYKEQLIIADGQNQFRASGMSGRHQNNQLVLSNKSMATLDRSLMQKQYLNVGKVDDLKQRYVDCYQEIAEVTTTKLGLATYVGNGQKLVDKVDQFKQLTIEQQRDTLDQILRNLHCNASYELVPALKLPSTFGRIRSKASLPVGTVVVNQSPTGLFEKRFILK